MQSGARRSVAGSGGVATSSWLVDLFMKLPEQKGGDLGAGR